MTIGHIILGSPWQFDHNSNHEGKITLSFQGHKFILFPLIPQQVREDEIQLKAKIDSEKE